jgi:CheY-like chemotaxis protein
VEKMLVLLVEDNQSDINSCLATVKRYNLERNIEIKCIVAESRDKALGLLDLPFDGAIIDIKLDHDGTEGNDIISEIHKRKRIPIAVLTGTPGNVIEECFFLGSFKKGEIGYEEIFNMIFEVYGTGLTKILGGRGELEEAMGNIFWNHLLPQLQTWKNYRTEGHNTEKEILRTVLNHLLELPGNEDIPSVPEEMYIIPPMSFGIKTGSIYTRPLDGKRFIVISPPCDLAVRGDGTFKTDKILVAEIADFEPIKSIIVNGVKASKQARRLTELLQNKYTEYYHWLAETNLFISGVINFRWTCSVNKETFEDEYGTPIAQLSAPFVKDVISRFSAFYARQGQPDFHFNSLAEGLLK